jgi:hypothetical protein
MHFEGVTVGNVRPDIVTTFGMISYEAMRCVISMSESMNIVSQQGPMNAHMRLCLFGHVRTVTWFCKTWLIVRLTHSHALIVGRKAVQLALS